MVRKFVFLALFLLVGAVIVSSCKKEELSGKKEILSFIFDASKNAQLDRNFLGVIKETNVSAEIAFGASTNQLIPTIEISPRATLSPASGVATDFSAPVIYTVTAEDKTTKTFTVSVSTAPAPYIGKWTGGPIDFGLGLLRVNAEFTAEGAVTLEFSQIMTGDKDVNSMKGVFEPISMQNTEIKIDQTHRWLNNSWSNETTARTMMYQVINPQSIKLFYCICNPRTDWWFQINLVKQ